MQTSVTRTIGRRSSGFAPLRRLGARVADSDWAVGVDLHRIEIGPQELIVYCDAHSLDIEGPDDLVRRVVSEYGRRRVEGDEA